MPTPPAALTASALVDTRVDAAIAEHDLAGHLGGVEHRRDAAVVERREAERHRSGIGSGQTGGRRIDERRRADCGANDAPGYVAPLPSVTEPLPLRLCVPAATVVTHGPGCATVPRRRAAVARRSRDEHAGVRGEQECDLDRVREVRRRAADRVIDDVDAVGYRLCRSPRRGRTPEPLAVAVSTVDHSALYIAIRARGAMPLTLAERRAGSGHGDVRGCRPRSTRCACRDRCSRGPT